jgi:hypothetical protein
MKTMKQRRKKLKKITEDRKTSHGHGFADLIL